ncbi:uncharacterized protein Ecym_5679 [Eremothecium cymbalariae DBVPG|uniref:FH2 domain-containing protein n=1 Tax=Eremothecium cymbalariae (strain CBS 270.75 / DBVPG 7215 / KCTC 17166 / NRRL Y-17582) TaxID=931890 RepID=I6NEB6_ERECY|nr:hypothetical protein Ecym_5679 [Eremothecium cymbalariae DBVPG\
MHTRECVPSQNNSLKPWPATESSGQIIGTISKGNNIQQDMNSIPGNLDHTYIATPVKDQNLYKHETMVLDYGDAAPYCDKLILPVTNFDKDVVPDEAVVNFHFNRILSNKNVSSCLNADLGKLSCRKKWDLVCNAQNRRNVLNPSRTPSNSEDPAQEVIRFLNENLNDPITLPNIWYQLEKLLRHRYTCQVFLSEGGISKLLRQSVSVTKEMEYVYLRCFKTLINQKKGRLEILQNIEVTKMLSLFVGNSNSQARTRLITTDILLLLTYMDSAKISRELEPYYSEWFTAFDNTISDESQWHQSSFIIQKPQQLMIDYCVSTMFLVNSIVQGLPSYNEKRKTLAMLKYAGIHRIFQKISNSKKRFDSEILLDQIAKYRDREVDVASKFTIEQHIEQNISFASQVNTILNLAQSTSLEPSMAKLFESVIEIIKFRKCTESAKILELLALLLSYLLENSYCEDDDGPENALKLSLNTLMINLLFNKTAIKELDEMKLRMEEMKEVISQLETKNLVLSSPTFDKNNSIGGKVSKKLHYIAELEEKLEAIEKQRKNDGTRYKHDYVHKGHDGKYSFTKNAISLFAALKNGNGLPHSNIGRSSSIVRNKRVSLTVLFSDDCNRRSFSGPEGMQSSESENRDFINLGQPHKKKVKQSKLNNIVSPDLSPQLSEPHALLAPSPTLTLCSNVGGNTAKIPKIIGASVATSTEIPLLSKDQSLLPPPAPPVPKSLMNNVLKLSPPTSVRRPTTVMAPPAPPLPQYLLNHGTMSQRTPMSQQARSGTSGSTFSAIPPPPPPLPVSLSAGSLYASQIPSLTSCQKVKLKQIHWDKIDDISKTVWSDDKERVSVSSELANFGVFKEIEELFKIVPAAPKVGNTMFTAQNTRNGKVTLLSNDLAQQFGINLYIFSNYSVEELVEKVLLCDTEVMKNQSVIEFFSKDDINHIPQSIQRMFAPYETNYLTGDKPEKDSRSLDRADRIYLELFYNLRSYWAPRAKYLLALLTYEKDYYDILYKLQRIDDGTTAIKTSKRLKPLLFIIIEVGNYMNNKQALGIQLSSLNKLAFTKTSKDNNLSFIHVIESIVRLNYPDLHGFVNDLEKILDVSNIIVQHVQQEAQEFYEKISTLERSLRVGVLSDSSKFHPKDKFLINTESNISHAMKKADLLKQQCTLTMGEFDKLMVFWGEDPNNVFSKNTFFQKFLDFALLFKKANKENIEREVRRVCESRRYLLEKTGNSHIRVDRSERCTLPSLPADSDDQQAVEILIKRLRNVRQLDGKLFRDSKGVESSQPSSRARQKEDGDLLLRTREMLLGVKKI